NHTAEDEQHRVLELADQQAPDRDVKLHRKAEVPLNRLFQPFHVLNGKRLVETIARPDLRPLSCRRERSRQVHDRVPRSHPDGKKDDDGNREENENKMTSASYDVPDQSTPSLDSAPSADAFHADIQMVRKLNHSSAVWILPWTFLL